MSIKSVQLSSLHATLDPTDHCSDTIMYYGWEHCGFFAIKKEINAITALGKDTLKKNFDWKLSSPELVQQKPELDQNVDGRKIARIVEIPHSADAAQDRLVRIQLCKATLVNVIFENYIRSAQKLPLIPVFFGIDIDRNPYPTSPDTLCSKKPDLNDKITHKELRRAYKLCHDEKLPQEIMIVARKTFVFLKICIAEDGAATFKKIDAVWDAPQWQQALQARKASKAENPAPKKKPDWRKNICDAVAAHLKDSKPAESNPATANATLIEGNEKTAEAAIAANK